MQFYEKYLELCNSVGKSPSKVVLEIGLKKSAVTRWKAGGLPTDATMQKIADYFGVPMASLSGDKEKPAAVGNGLSENDMKILELLSLVPEERKASIVSLLEDTLRLSGLID